MMASIKIPNIPEFLMDATFPRMRPKGNEAILFLAHLDVFAEIPVSEEEHRRAESTSSTTARQAFLAGRRLVRNVLSCWLSVDPLKLAIRLSSEGRPYLFGDSVPFFSITHSGDLVMVAFSKEKIGADMELERQLDSVALASRFFSNQEALLISNGKNNETFFRLWTCREAAIKADGRGMGKLLATTKTNTDDQDGGFLNVEIGSDNWSAIHWMMGILEPRYHMALATKIRPSLIRWCDLR
jgi:hypothetical protein